MSDADNAPQAEGQPTQPIQNQATPKSFESLSSLQPEKLDDIFGVSERSLAKKQPPKAAATKDEEEEEDFGDEDEESEDDEDLEVDEEDPTPGDEDEDEGEEEDGEEDEEEESSTDDDEAVDEDSKKYKVKVNGEEREYSLKQLKTIAASGFHNLEKVQAVETELKQKFTSKMREVSEKESRLVEMDAKATPVFQAIKDGKLDQAYLLLAEHAGLNKLQVQRRLRDLFSEQIYQRLALPRDWVQTRLQEVRELNERLDLQEENQFLTEQQQKAKTAQESQSKGNAGDEAKSVLAQYQAEHGVSNADLQRARDFIWKDAPETERKPITLEQLHKTITAFRVVDKAVEAIEAVRPSLVEDDKFLDAVIAKLQKQPQWSVAKAARWVEKKARERADKANSAAAAASQRVLSKKVLKTKTKSSLTKPKTAQTKPGRFSDLGLL